MIQYRFDK